MGNRFYIKKTGVLNASGKDFIDFMNRISTADLRKFPVNEFRKTVLTTDKGRIIDLIYILNFENQQIILCTYENTEKVKAHLERYIIMDDVIIEKRADEYVRIISTGENLGEKPEEIFGTKPEKEKVYRINDDYFFTDDFKFDTFNIICKAEDADKYKILLSDFEEMNSDEYENMRIGAGLSESENELNENINPVECGLESLISFKKGCYIGQEVIARLDSQGKRPKQMVRIISENKIKSGDKIFDEENNEAGFVSSSVFYENKYTALGFIRSVNLDFEKKYKAEIAEEESSIIISNIN